MTGAAQSRTLRAALRLGTAAFALAVVLSPGIGRACAVCMAGREEENANAFIAMTALMTAMPFLVIGGVVYWLWRRARQLAEDEERDTDAPIRLPVES